MEIIDKIVDFEKYCKICKYKDYPEDAIPCCNCLEYPVNQNSQAPVEFKRTEDSKQENKNTEKMEASPIKDKNA